MSASVAIPPVSAEMLVIALATAPHLNSEEVAPDLRARAATIFADVLAASEAGGFKDSDILVLLAARGRLTILMETLAEEVVASIGGPEEFFALVALSSTPTDWIGFPQ